MQEKLPAGRPIPDLEVNLCLWLCQQRCSAESLSVTWTSTCCREAARRRLGSAASVAGDDAAAGRRRRQRHHHNAGLRHVPDRRRHHCECGRDGACLTPVRTLPLSSSSGAEPKPPHGPDICHDIDPNLSLCIVIDTEGSSPAFNSSVLLVWPGDPRVCLLAGRCAKLTSDRVMSSAAGDAAGGGGDASGRGLPVPRAACDGRAVQHQHQAECAEHAVSLPS